MLQPTVFLAPKYLTAFRCIGEACEATCCASGWQVPVDEDHYKRLKHAMQRTAAEREEFRAAHARNRDPIRDPRHYATLQPRENGSCAFLDHNQLCTVQARYGAEMLSDTCSLFPRLVMRAGDRIEVAGTVSCPEMARQALLAPDAFELVDLDPSTLPRYYYQRVVDPASGDGYTAPFDAVRALMLQLLASEEYPLASRLFFIAYFASRVTPFFARGVAVDEQRLADEAERLQQPEMLAELHQRFTAMEITRLPAFRNLQELLEARLTAGGRKRFRELAESVTAGLGVAAEGAGSEAALATFERRRDRVEARFKTRLDLYFANYARNYWFALPYTDSPTLLAHCQDLFLRMAALRFLLLGQPALDQADEAALDGLAVEVFYTFSRSIEHNQSLLDLLQRWAAKPETQTLAYSVLLLKF